MPVLGKIISISRYRTDDGPGIRTAVFLKGCPLSCIWCHNPESQSREPELMIDWEKCTKCGICAKICPEKCHEVSQNGHIFHREKCRACGMCEKACPAGALEISGKTVSADGVFREIEKDAVFYRTSGGGATLSGGEPLDQPAFSREILRLCREAGIHTAVETCGVGSEARVRSVLEFCDLVLLDLKETDDVRHRQYTGAPLSAVLNTLRLIDGMGVPFVIRMPIVPGYNDRPEHFQNAKRLVRGMPGCQGIEIMPYHTLGGYKYAQLQREYRCQQVAEPSADTVEEWRNAVN